MSNRATRSLIRRLLRGDEEAFARFFDDYFPPLFRFALSRLDGRSQLAEDVVQQTLVLALRKLHTYRGEAALLTWLCTLCRREMHAHLEKAGRRGTTVELLEERPEVRAALESLASRLEEEPEDGVLRREVGQRVRVALDLLPPNYGKALEWKYIYGFSVREIASRLGVSAKAAESLLTRARGAFRETFTTLTAEVER